MMKNNERTKAEEKHAKEQTKREEKEIDDMNLEDVTAILAGFDGLEKKVKPSDFLDVRQNESDCESLRVYERKLWELEEEATTDEERVLIKEQEAVIHAMYTVRDEGEELDNKNDVKEYEKRKKAFFDTYEKTKIMEESTFRSPTGSYHPHTMRDVKITISVGENKNGKTTTSMYQAYNMKIDETDKSWSQELSLYDAIYAHRLEENEGLFNKGKESLLEVIKVAIDELAVLLDDDDSENDDLGIYSL